MSIPKFNRHEHMDSVDRGIILDCINELSECETNTKSIENMLYGFFDGFDYSSVIEESSEMNEIKLENPNLHLKILVMSRIVKNYPKYENS